MQIGKIEQLTNTPAPLSGGVIQIGTGTGPGLRGPDDSAARIAALEAELAQAKEALTKINDIRNSIVGLQTLNWSEHAYPLVAILNAAGFPGMSYADAKDNYGTMLQRTVKAEAERDALAAQVAALVDLIGVLWEAESHSYHHTDTYGVVFERFDGDPLIASQSELFRLYHVAKARHKEVTANLPAAAARYLAADRVAQVADVTHQARWGAYPDDATTAKALGALLDEQAPSVADYRKTISA
jgi:hypothetical protein